MTESSTPAETAPAEGDDADGRQIADARSGTVLIATSAANQKQIKLLESVLSLGATVSMAFGAPGMVASGTLGGVSAGLRLLFPPQQVDIVGEIGKQIKALHDALVKEIADNQARENRANFLADLQNVLDTLAAGPPTWDKKKQPSKKEFLEAHAEWRHYIDEWCDATKGTFLHGMQLLKTDLGTSPPSQVTALGLFAAGAVLHMKLEAIRALWQGTEADASWRRQVKSFGTDWYTFIKSTIDDIMAKRLTERMSGVHAPAEYAIHHYLVIEGGYPDTNAETYPVTAIVDSKRADQATRPVKDPRKDNPDPAENEHYEYSGAQPDGDVTWYRLRASLSSVNPWDTVPYYSQVEADTRSFYEYTVAQEASLYVLQHLLKTTIDTFKPDAKKPLDNGSQTPGTSAAQDERGQAVTEPVRRPTPVGRIATAAEYDELTTHAFQRRMNTFMALELDASGAIRTAAGWKAAASARVVAAAPKFPGSTEDTTPPTLDTTPAPVETVSNAVVDYATACYITKQITAQAVAYAQAGGAGEHFVADATALDTAAQKALDAALDAATGPEGNIALYRLCHIAEGLGDVALPVDPLPPDDITATFHSDTKTLYVKWTNALTTNTSYKVYGSPWEPVGDLHGTLLTTVDGKATEAVIDAPVGDLALDTVQYVIVSAVTDLEAYSAPVAVIQPAPPTNITAVYQPHARSLHIVWTPGTGAHGYNIYASVAEPTGDDHGTLLQTVGGAAVDTVIDPGKYALEPDKIRFIVVAGLSDSSTLYAAPVAVTSQPVDPVLPTGITAVYQPDPNRVLVTWTPAAYTNTGYDIYISQTLPTGNDHGQWRTGINGGDRIGTDVTTGDRDSTAAIAYIVVCAKTDTGQAFSAPVPVSHPRA
ncbi:hypothetical protein ABZ926_12690 [Streptomyces litmocidini]|uniref:hypothetical protein n=1 Tax=Streptomyces litmocidini TaxID=67318 RepID=UPI0033C3EF7F